MPSEIINKFGAVSKETVHAMLDGFGTETVIAISGIAGPGGGTDEKPVGTVYIGIKIKSIFIVKKFFFDGNRQEIRENATLKALEFLRDELLEEYKSC